MAWKWMSCLTALTGTPCHAAADDGTPGAAPDLSRVLRPWEQPVRRPTSDEYAATLRFWSERHAEIMTLETRGRSQEGQPILLAKVTDPSVDDEDKQIVLVTGMHSGAERTGTTTILHFMEWLLGDALEAVATRRRQIVLLMPVVNPWGYEHESNANSQGIDPYSGQRGAAWDIERLELRDPERAAEIAAYKSVVDEFAPDVHADLHGVSLRWNGQQVVESCGTAYSNYALRPWDWRVTEAMIAGARAAGYGIDRGEADSQRLFRGPDMTPVADRLWMGRPFFYTATYGYIRCHTLPITAEVGWEESGVARLQALMGIGNGTWEGESVAGYPVNVMKSLVGQWVMAWGRTAAERRRNRIGIWRRQGGFTLGILYPQTDGRIGFVVALTANGAAAMDRNPVKLVANFERQPGVDAAAVRAFLQSGPEDQIYFEPSEGAPADLPLEQGLAIRLRIPYRNPELCDLRLNGRRVDAGEVDGFQRWYGDGYTQVQINISPEKLRAADLLMVTCAYVPDVARQYGWRPPQEVLDRLANRRDE